MSMGWLMITTAGETFQTTPRVCHLPFLQFSILYNFSLLVVFPPPDSRANHSVVPYHYYEQNRINECRMYKVHEHTQRGGHRFITEKAIYAKWATRHKIEFKHPSWSLWRRTSKNPDNVPWLHSGIHCYWLLIFSAEDVTVAGAGTLSNNMLLMDSSFFFLFFLPNQQPHFFIHYEWHDSGSSWLKNICNHFTSS